MFKLEKEPRFWWHVDIHMPTGQTKTVIACELEFRAGPLPEGEGDWLTRRVTGWKDVGDQDGNPLPFTPENLASFLAIDYVRTSVANAYVRAVDGAVQRKN